jgi:hypothetical protein
MLTPIELKDKIITAANRELLERISDLIDFVYTDVHEMIPGEIEAVEACIRQIENGQWVSHEKSNRRIDELFKSKTKKQE